MGANKIQVAGFDAFAVFELEEVLPNGVLPPGGAQGRQVL